MIDEIDAKILDILYENSRTANAEIARRVGLTPSTIAERIKKLERNGIIKGYRAVLDHGALGKKLLAFVFVTLSDFKNTRRIGGQLSNMEMVEEVHHNAGPECFLLKVRCGDTDELMKLLLDINDIKDVRSTNTTIVLRAVKEGGGGCPPHLGAKSLAAERGVEP